MTVSAQTTQKPNIFATVSLVAAAVAILGAILAAICFAIIFSIVRWSLANGPSGILDFVSTAAQRLLMISFWGLTPIGGIGALITGGVALRQIGKDAGQGGKARAVIGMVVGVAVVVIEVLFFCAALFKAF